MSYLTLDITSAVIGGVLSMFGAIALVATGIMATSYLDKRKNPFALPAFFLSIILGFMLFDHGHEHIRAAQIARILQQQNK